MFNNNDTKSNAFILAASVKYFPSVKYFQVKIFSGNENIFKCLIAFQKIL